VIFRKFLRQEFQGPEATQLGVLSLTYDTHVAVTEFLHDSVVEDRLADQGLLTSWIGANTALMEDMLPSVRCTIRWSLKSLVLPL
jgi:hypothetical protein